MSGEWNGDKVLTDLEKQLGDNLETAAIYFKDKVKEALNVTGQPFIASRGEDGIRYENEVLSEPGEPPRKMTGFLQRSIAHEMSEDRTQAFVGTNLDYGLYLELGTSKMAARPFLRSTLAVEQETIAKIVATGNR